MTTSQQLHVVLGAGGIVGDETIAELKRRNLPVRSVRRSASTLADSVQADLLSVDQVTDAVRGASHIYLCAGLKYTAATWQREWPVVMDNVISAAKATDARIVFVDNIYMYGPPPLQNPITENHPLNPTSKKGKVRKQIAQALLDAHDRGDVRALIARAADFYGPNAKSSVLYFLTLTKILAGQKPIWIGNPDALHSFTHTGDIGRAMPVLALDDDAYGQVWHLPTAAPAMSVQAMVSVMGQILGKNAQLSVIPSPIVSLMTLFVETIREYSEMRYQYTSDYVFSSAKFEQRYPDFAITPYAAGIEQMVKSFAGNG